VSLIPTLGKMSALCDRLSLRRDFEQVVKNRFVIDAGRRPIEMRLDFR
jgi:hypothetical protein